MNKPGPTIGILCLDSAFQKPCGHIRNPSTYSFPTLTRILQDVDIPRMLFHPTPELVEPFLNAARELVTAGADAIAGSCGFMARFQGQIAAELPVPVLLSSLIQLPLIRLMHGAGARIGVLTASRRALTQDHFANCATTMDSVSIRGMEGNTEFRETILEGRRNEIDLTRLQAEVVGTAHAFAQEERLDVLLLECTDLSAFAAAVQQTTHLPVYDINTLVEYAAGAVCRREYKKITDG